MAYLSSCKYSVCVNSGALPQSRHCFCCIEQSPVLLQRLFSRCHGVKQSIAACVFVLLQAQLLLRFWNSCESFRANVRQLKWASTSESKSSGQFRADYIASHRHCSAWLLLLLQAQHTFSMSGDILTIFAKILQNRLCVPRSHSSKSACVQVSSCTLLIPLYFFHEFVRYAKSGW